MSLQRCKQETTSREFIEWLEWMDRQELAKDKEFTREQQYLARIAMEVHNTQRKKGQPLKKFQLKFQRRQVNRATGPSESLAAWNAILGDDSNGNRRSRS